MATAANWAQVDTTFEQILLPPLSPVQMQNCLYLMQVALQGHPSELCQIQ